MKAFKKKSIASEDDLKDFIVELDRQFDERFKEFKKKNKDKQ